MAIAIAPDSPHAFEGLAALVGLSPGRTRHLFVQQTGLPFRTYLLWLRLVRAVEIFAGGAWEVDATDATRIDDMQVRDGASSISAIDVDVAVVGQSPQYVVASVATASHLIVQLWEVDAVGVLDFIEQFKTAASPWTSAQLSSAHVGDQDVMVGLRTVGGNLSLLSFHVDPAGTIRRTGTMDGGSNTGLSLFGHADNGRVVTLQSDSGGVLKLSSYRTNYSASL